MKCTKINCPMQAGIISDDCDQPDCHWRTESVIDVIDKPMFLIAVTMLSYLFDKDSPEYENFIKDSKSILDGTYEPPEELRCNCIEHN